MVDHSCSHDRQREDGFNVEHMNKSFGGNQTKMQDITTAEQQGFLIAYFHSEMLKPGDIQTMVFHQHDSGPFWMTPQEREKQRHDEVIEGQFLTKKCTKKELTKILKQGKNIEVKGKLMDIIAAA
jgi:hypothetical protein